MTYMCTHFNTKTDVAKNLIIFFLTLTVRGPFHRKDFKWNKIWGCRVNFWKNGSFVRRTSWKSGSSHRYLFCNKRFFTVYLFCALFKNHWKIRSRCLVHEFSFTDIFNDINHGYRAPILKKNSLWLLPFYMVVSHFCYEKVRRTMRTAIVSSHLKWEQSSI